MPDAPQLLTATPANQSLTLQWTAPTSNGGAAISDYLIERWGNASTGWVPVPDPVSTATSHTLTGLVNGTLVHFRVRARQWGRHQRPEQPRIRHTTDRADCAAHAHHDPDRGGAGPAVVARTDLQWGRRPVTDYVVQRSPNGTTGWVPVTDGVNVATTYTVTGLSTTTPTFFRVFARNVAGQSTSSSNTANAIALSQAVGGAQRRRHRGRVRRAPALVARSCEHRRRRDHGLCHRSVAERINGLDDARRRREHGDDLHRDQSDERNPLLLPDLREECGRFQGRDQPGVGGAADGADGAPDPGCVSGRFGPGAVVVGSSREPRRRRDHRLRDPALTDRHRKLDPSARECLCRHQLHGRRSDERREILLPGLRAERGRLQPLEQHRHRDAENSAVGADGATGGAYLGTSDRELGYAGVRRRSPDRAIRPPAIDELGCLVGQRLDLDTVDDPLLRRECREWLPPLLPNRSSQLRGARCVEHRGQRNATPAVSSVVPDGLHPNPLGGCIELW